MADPDPTPLSDPAAGPLSAVAGELARLAVWIEAGARLLRSPRTHRLRVEGELRTREEVAAMLIELGTPRDAA